MLRVATLASREVQAQTQTADPADIDAWWDQASPNLLRTVTVAAGATATLAVRYLRRHAAIERVRLDPVRSVPPAEQVATSLRVMGPVAFKKHMRISGSAAASLRTMVSQLAGTASSRALDGDRDTAMATFAERDEMVGWRRQLNSPKPCAFCVMLASRGAVYAKDTVDFRAHTPNCHCTAEPLYTREDEPAPVEALRAEWDEATEGLSGAAALRAFRKARAT